MPNDAYGQCGHPSGFIIDEMTARNWTTEMLIDAMMVHYEKDRLRLEMILGVYFNVGPTTKQVRMGNDLARLFHKSLGLSEDFFIRLEQEWLNDPTQPFPWATVLK